MQSNIMSFIRLLSYDTKTKINQVSTTKLSWRRERKGDSYFEPKKIWIIFIKKNSVTMGWKLNFLFFFI